MAVSGSSWRMTRAASSPSVVWVGGHPDVSYDQFGRGLAHKREQLGPVGGLRHYVESGAIEQTGQTLPQ